LALIDKEAHVNVGLKVILLAVAIILFIIGAFSDTNWPEFFGLGLACVAAALAAEELGFGKMGIGQSSAPRRDTM
jgi:1,4-dihydroxy-2-naphthoate octaprenyltransferase